jgi:hypothetical protein
MLEGKRILELIISLVQGIFMKQQIEQPLEEELCKENGNEETKKL